MTTPPTSGDSQQRRRLSAEETIPAEPRKPAHIGRYRVVSQLGRGGMGTVYQVEDTTLDRVVALKRLSEIHKESPSLVERLLREAKTAAQIRHPCVAHVYSVERDEEGTPFLTMEYLEGETLARVLEREGPLAAERAVELFLKLAGALQVAREQGVIHRDIKPSNIVLDREGSPKLLDFGLASWVDRASELTRSGQMMGTPLYLSPEQARGFKCDHRSDIYSLGVSLYHVLVGSPPFEAESAADIIAMHLRETPPSARDRAEGIPTALALIVEKMLAKDPADRYQDYEALIADLRRSLVPGARAPVRPSRLPWAAAAVGLGLGLLVLLLYLLGPLRPDGSPDADGANGQQVSNGDNQGSTNGREPPPVGPDVDGSHKPGHEVEAEFKSLTVPPGFVEEGVYRFCYEFDSNMELGDWIPRQGQRGVGGSRPAQFKLPDVREGRLPLPPGIGLEWRVMMKAPARLQMSFTSDTDARGGVVCVIHSSDRRLSLLFSLMEKESTIAVVKVPRAGGRAPSRPQIVASSNRIRYEPGKEFTFKIELTPAVIRFAVNETLIGEERNLEFLEKPFILEFHALKLVWFVDRVELVTGVEAVLRRR